MSEVAESPRTLEDPRPAAFERNVELAAKGMGVNVAGKLLARGQRFVLAVVLARLLGVEHYGLYNLTLTVATLAGGLALLGLDTALVRYVSTLSSRRDHRGLWGALQVGVGLPTLLGAVLGLGLFALASPLAERWFHEPKLAPLLQMASLLVPLLALGDVVAAATQGFKNQHYTVIARAICQPVVRLIALLAMAIVGLNAGRAVAAFMLAVAASAFLLLYFLNRQFALRRPIATARRDTRELLSFSLPVYFSDVISTLTTNIQTLILGTVATVSTVGIYALAGNVNVLGGLIYSSVTVTSLPIIAELHDRRQPDQLRRFYQTTTRWAFGLNFPFFLILILFPEALLALFGEGFVDGSDALRILVWATLVKTATGTNSSMLDMTGHTKLRLANAIVAALVTITLNALLIPSMGMLGAAVAVLTGTIIIESLRIAEVYVLLRMLPYNAGFAKPIVAGLLALGVVLASRLVLPGSEHGVVDAAARAVLLVGVYVGAVLLLGLSPDDRTLVRHLQQRLTSRLSRRPRLG